MLPQVCHCLTWDPCRGRSCTFRLLNSQTTQYVCIQCVLHIVTCNPFLVCILPSLRYKLKSVVWWGIELLYHNNVRRLIHIRRYPIPHIVTCNPILVCIWLTVAYDTNRSRLFGGVRSYYAIFIVLYYNHGTCLMNIRRYPIPQHAARVLLMCIRWFRTRRCGPHCRPSVVESVGDGCWCVVLLSLLVAPLTMPLFGCVVVLL